MSDAFRKGLEAQSASMHEFKDEPSAATTESRLAAVDAILAEIELTGYGMGTGPSQPSIRDLARRARKLLAGVRSRP